MQKEYVPVGGASAVFTDTKEQLIECELVLPDYYPEIGKVLKCGVSAGVEDVARSGDKVSVAGKADIKLVYLDADKRVNIYNSLAKYTRVFSGLQPENEDVFFVRQTLSGTEHRACGPRKCEVRAVAAVKLTCIRKTELNALTLPDPSGAEVMETETESFCLNAAKRFDLAFSDTVELPDAGAKIGGVLYSSAELSVGETKVIKNKVMIKGSCELTARFVTVKGDVTQEASFTLPFTEIAGFPGASENDECKLCADSVNARLTVSEDGNSAQVFVSAQMSAAVGVMKKTTLPEDIFSVNEDVSLQRTPFSVITEIAPADREFSVSADAECYDASANAVEAFFTDVPVCSLVLYNGKPRISGTVGVNFLVSGADGTSLISRSCNFDEDAGVSDGGESFISCSARIVSAALKNGRIEYTVRVKVSGWCVKTEERSFITGAEFEKSAGKTGNTEKIVLYYAHPGEKIWNIAKENGCSAGKIKELNDFTGDSVEESRMLVLVK